MYEFINAIFGAVGLANVLYRTQTLLLLPLAHSFLEVSRKIGNGKVGNGTKSQEKVGNMDKRSGIGWGMGGKRLGMKRSGMGMNLRKRSGMPAIPDLFSRE